MLETLVITLREGIEAFLIVAITLAYLRQTGRRDLASAVYWSTGIAIVASVVASIALGKASNQPLWEGILAAIAAVLVVSMVVYMLRAAKHLRRHIAEQLDRVSQRSGNGAWLGVFAFVLLMIVREGMETALLISSLMFQAEDTEMASGGLIGISLAAALAWAWSRFGSRINLPRFFQVTSVFLLLFSVQLVIYAFHEFTEAGALPLLDNSYWHLATEPFSPEGVYGHWLSYGLVIVPLGWLGVILLRERWGRQVKMKLG
jgi:high-affinity iron transporter